MNHIIGKLYISDDLYTEQELKKNNIGTIIDCMSDGENKLNFKNYYNFKMHDDQEQNILKYFYDIFKIIDKSKKNVLVHCRAGISRSCASVIAYLIYNGVSYKNALALVKKQRPQCSPNNNFKRQLKYLDHLINIK